MGKTTNKLLAAAARAAAGQLDDARRDADTLRAFHRAEAIALGVERPKIDALLETHFDELETTLEKIATSGQLTDPLWDEVCSYGERLSSAIVALGFPACGVPAVHVDARTVVITDGRHTQAQPLYGRTYRRFAERAAALAGQGVIVMGGFIGSTPNGETTTLGRGGSDFSAALAGAGVEAEEIQIWTDVDGMLTCDPRVLPGGHLVKRISFAEAAELAYFGAKVLHPATVQPAIEKNIPVRILNSRHPASSGTLILNENVPSTVPLKSIACKRDITVVEVRSLRMLMAHGFLRRIFEVFDRYHTSVDMVTTSEVCVALTIDHAQALPDIEAELSRIAEVSIVRDQAVVCVVGDALRETAGLGARIFGALRDVNIRMISQGASFNNVSFVVDGKDLAHAVAALHAEFFTELDDEVFQAQGEGI
jgi:aspartate kinase